MDEKEEGILLGELKSFRHHAMDEIRGIKSDLSRLTEKVDSLDRFKLKVTIIMASVMGGIELCFRIYEALK